MQAKESNKRSSERFELTKPLTVKDPLDDSIIGTLVNISADGLMVLGAQKVVDGCVYNVKIDVGTVTSGSQTLHLGLECLWVSEADCESKLWSGYKIIDISSDDKKLLNMIIEQLE